MQARTATLDKMMDDIDLRLLAHLRSDARQSVSTLAAALGVSRATVRARMDRLLAVGVIRGFTVVLRDEAEDGKVRAIMMIGVEGRASEHVMKRLHGFPEIRALYATNGRWDIVAELATETLEAFDRTLSRIRELDGIATTETSILLSARKRGR